VSAEHWRPDGQHQRPPGVGGLLDFQSRLPGALGGIT
jgi:hypothetical protein